MIERGSDRASLRGRAVLVTGASGMLGRRLLPRLLAEGANVAALTRDRARARRLWPGSAVECRPGDLADPATLRDLLAGIEIVFHLASHSGSRAGTALYNDPAHWSVTALGTRTLVAAAAAQGVSRLIFLSSVKAMGDAAGALGHPSDETVEPDPDTCYGRAKLEAERSVLRFGAERQCHTAVLRLPMVYGVAGQGQLTRMIDAIARGRFPPWPRVENRRSAIHADDAVEALMLAAQDRRANGEIYLVTDGQRYSTRWLYERIGLALGRPIPGWALPLWMLTAAATVGTALEALTGRAMPLTRTSLGSLCGDAWYSSNKIEAALGFKPQRSLRSEIPLLVGDYLRGAGSAD